MVMRTGAFTGFEVTLREPGIAWIQLNQPERLNGLTHSIKRDLVETITQAQMDHRVRVLVFTGSGRAFSAGDDISGQNKPLSGEALMPPIPPGHDSEIGTYEGLRHLSQTLNLAIRNCDNHVQGMPLDVQNLLAPHPHGIVRYWTSKFPCLLITVYRLVRKHWSDRRMYWPFLWDRSSEVPGLEHF